MRVHIAILPPKIRDNLHTQQQLGFWLNLRGWSGGVRRGSRWQTLLNRFSFIALNLSRGNVQKNITFKDIIQIEVDPPASHPIFEEKKFDTVLIMLTH